MRERIAKILKKSAGILLLVAVTSILGCIEEKSEYTINPDGSGKVTLDLKSSSPVDASYTEPGATPQEQIKPPIEKILIHSKGIDTWKDISFELTDEGSIHFTGTAYFTDINKLVIHGGGLDTISKLQFSTSTSGQITLELASHSDPRNREKEAKATEYTEAELVEQVKLAKLRYNQSKAMMAMMLNGLKQDMLIHLPAKIEKISNLQRIDDTTIRWQLDGGKILEKMDQVMTDDKWLKREIRENRGPITDNLDDFFINEIVFRQKGAVQVVLSPKSETLFDYETEVKAAKENYDRMISKLGLCLTQTSRIEAPTAPHVTAKPGTVKVGGVQLVRHADEKRGIRPLHSSNGYTLSLILELPEPNVPITHGRVEKAITDTNESILRTRGISFPELSRDGKTLVFEVNLSVPDKEAKRIAELSGTLAYVESAGTKRLDLGVIDFREGAKSHVEGFSIRSIRSDWREGYALMELNVDMLRGTIKSAAFYREDGTEIEVSPGGKSFSQDKLLDVGYKTRGEFPPRGRIVFEVLDNVTKHKIHFKLTNISLTGEPL